MADSVDGVIGASSDKIGTAPQSEDEVQVVGQTENFFQRIGSLRLEVFLILFVFSSFSVMTVLQDVMLKKACINELHYNRTICNNLDDVNYTTYKESVEKFVTTYATISDIMRTLLSAFVSIFAGAYGTRYGIKLPLVIAAFGTLTGIIGQLATVYYMQWPLWANIVVMIPEGLSGGFIVVLTGIYTNATFAVPIRRRNTRFFIIDIAMGTAISLGGLFGGLLYKAYGAQTVYRISVLVGALGLAYVIIFYKDITYIEEYKEDGLGTRLKHFFSFKAFIESYRVVARPRENGGRRKLILLFVSMCLLVLAFMSTSALAYIYVKELYSWTVTQYASFNSINMSVSTVLNVVVIFLFTKVFRMSDTKLVSTGLLFGISKYVVLSLAMIHISLYYIQAVLGIPFMISMVGVRAFISKLVDPDEIGSVFAFLSSCERVVPVAGDLLSTVVFNSTISFWPGMIYMIDGLMLVLAFVLVVFGVGSSDVPYETLVTSPLTINSDNNKEEAPSLVEDQHLC